MPHQRPFSPASFQSAPSRSGTGPDADPEVAHSPPNSTGSILVWAQPGPEAEAQSLWTAALARGLGRAVTLIDVVEASGSLGAEAELRERARHRMNVLQRHSESDFAEVPTDLQVHLSMRTPDGIVEAAVSERRDFVVLWAPVQENLIRKLLQKKADTVLVVRSPRHRADLPWTVGVAEDDMSALPVAHALVAGSNQEASLEIVPELIPNAPGDAPTSVVCVSRPTPGWWASRVLRRRRETPPSGRAVIEVYSAETPAP